MIISTDRLIPYMFIFMGVFLVFYAAYCVKTGEANISYVVVSKKTNPKVFAFHIYLYVILAIASFAMAALTFLGVIH
jgi:hypothetical protein